MNIKQIFNDFATELLPDYKTEVMSFKNFEKAAKYIIDSQKIICRLEKPVSDDFCVTSLDELVKKYLPDSEVIIVRKKDLEAVKCFIASLSGDYKRIEKMKH